VFNGLPPSLAQPLFCSMTRLAQLCSPIRVRLTFDVAIASVNSNVPERGLCFVRKVHPNLMNASEFILRSSVQDHIPLVEPAKHLHEPCPFATVIQQIPAGGGHELPQVSMDELMRITRIARVESNKA
jgi:hypothetical protein